MKKFFLISTLSIISLMQPKEAQARKLFGTEFVKTGGHTDDNCAYVDGITTHYFLGFGYGTESTSKLVGCI